MRIRLKVNGRAYERDVADHWSLLRFLRDGLDLTGTKEGCSMGECGICTVLLDGRPVNSCLVLAAECDGAEVETVEGERKNGRLSPVQEALDRHFGVQCGFCTPGMTMLIKDLLRRNPRPTEEEIREGIEGCFCRCTGYRQIIEAVLDLTGQLKRPGELKRVR